MSAARIETYTLPAGSTCHQTALFPAAPIVGRDDPETSKIAAEAFAPTGKLSPLQTRIMDAFHDQQHHADRLSIPAQGFNPSEMATALGGLYPPTIDGRFRELRAAGLLEIVEVDGLEIFRPSDRGKPSRVHRLA